MVSHELDNLVQGMGNSGRRDQDTLSLGISGRSRPHDQIESSDTQSDFKAS